MKKILIISFYKSSNLGDIELSGSIEEILRTPKTEIIKYNFSTAEKILESDDFKTNKNLKAIKKKWFRSLIIHFIRKVLGESIYTRFYWKLKTSKTWEAKRMIVNDIKECDYIVFAGGNMIMDLTPMWIYYLKFYSDKIKFFNKPYYFLYVGAGPLKYFNSKKILKKVFAEVTGVSVRDEKSGKILDNLINNKKVIRTVDPVFKDALCDFQISSRNDHVPRIGICILGQMCFDSEDEHVAYLKGLKDVIFELKKELKTELYLFSTEKMDYKAVNDFYRILLDTSEINIQNIDNINDLKGFYNKLDYLIGGRMHSMILAQNLLLPYLGVIWQEKIIGFSKLTNRNHAMFSTKTLHTRKEEIIDLIKKDLKDKNITILEMSQTNRELKKLVYNGKIV